MCLADIYTAGADVTVRRGFTTDTQFEASVLARHMSCPTRELMRPVVHDFRYLSGTEDLAKFLREKVIPYALWTLTMLVM
jgi:hypothetical protein